ncbi:MAG: DEAD/DEAH box helicase [Firmicutes bacterium]|nr:DEAD/DEAH box helicase [Bacillota bacterium]
MFPFSITDKMIQNQVSHATTYQKGFMYYLKNRIVSFSFDQEALMLEAEVVGEEAYDVTIYFSEQGAIEECCCNCLAFDNYPGICKHIVAVLKRAQQEFEKNSTYSSPAVWQNRKRNIPAQLFDDFESMAQNQKKQAIALEAAYEFERDLGQYFSSITLRIGIERLYVVKNIKQFLRTITTGEPLVFGKNFTFHPTIHAFEGQDKAIIDLLQEVYEYEATLQETSLSPYARGGVFRGKKVYLPSPAVKRFFRAVENTPFIATILAYRTEEIRILTQDLPLSFQLTQQGDYLCLDLREKQQFVPLTADASHVYYKGFIYEISENQRKCFISFYHAFKRNIGKGIIFEGEQRERLVSELLPIVKKAGKTIIDKAVEESLYQEALQVSMYFDKNGKGISAKIEFHYGDEVINPFRGKPKDSEDHRLLVRDVPREREIMTIFEQADFNIKEGLVYLKEEEKIFGFVYDVLPQLQQQAEVYYSDDFKNIKIKDPHAFSAGIRLNEMSNLLEFSFRHEDIPDAQLEELFASIRQKKKYHRLKDGSFIPLNGPALEPVAQLVENLDISPKDLKKKVIELPKYRAMYVDSTLREAQLQHFERNIAFKQLVQNIKEPQDMEFAIPDELQSVLRGYQKVGFKWFKTLAAYGLGGILADDMGLGKTLQVIAFVLSEKESSLPPSLVIAPTSLLYNWQDEVKKFVPHMHVVVVSGSQQERQQQLQNIENADFVITSYPLIRRDIEQYAALTFGYCFLDEAQHIKNPHTISAKVVKQVKAKGYFALTGTPVENTLTELWSIFDFIMPGYLFSHTKFIKKYERPIVKKEEQPVLEDLNKHIRPFVLRRMKKDVLKELPEKIESKMTAQMTAEQTKVYLAYLHQARKEVAKEIAAEGFERSRMKILAMLTRLRQICCHPALFIDRYQGGSGKMSLLMEILEDAIDSGHRILLFSQFTTMLGIMKQYFNKAKITYFYLDGATKAEERRKLVHDFNKGERKVFLISLKAGGTGLNLTGADMVIHFDPWWNPAVEEQATDRAYRIGQENVVQVMKMITKGTIEEKIYALQQKKKKMIESVIQPGETLLSKMTGEEIQMLFE